MKHTLSPLLLVLSMLFFALPLASQPERVVVNGVVTDSSGEPVIGAAVYDEANKTNGITTNDSGAFSFGVSPSARTLIVSCIGFETQKVDIRKRKTGLKVTMRDKSETINEVVVTGMQHRGVESFTGSAVTYNDRQLKEIGNGNVLQSLKTLDPSFDLQDNNIMGSDPNQTLQIEIRGKTNVAGLTEEYQNDPNQPLFILDGFESTLATISDLSMDRVKSITLLKDASATAIYGSKAANGVVVVETKAPEAGRLRVNYNGNLNFTWADLTDYNLMNAAEKLEFEKLALCYGAIDPENGQPYYERYARQYNENLAEVQRGVDSYWLAEPLRLGVVNRHNLFVEGGDNTFRYGVGVNMGNTQGVMKGSDRRVANGNIRLIYRRGKFSFTENLNIDYVKADHESVEFSKFAQASPYLRKRNEDGTIPLMQSEDLMWDVRLYNPMYNWQNNNMNTQKSSGFTNNFEADWRPLPELRARAKIGLGNDNSRSRVFRSPFNTEFIESAAEERGTYSESNNTYWNYDGDLSVTYGKLLARKHQVNAILGSRITNTTNAGSSFALRGFVDEDIVSAIFAQEYVFSSRSTTNIKRRTASFYGNLNYAFDSRYLLDASWRNDGSSVFGVNKHFTSTWSAGLGWNLHNERFMQRQHFFNYLKVRGSIGNPGNQNFSDYISMKIYNYNSSFPTPAGSSIVISKFGNDDLKWQKTLDQNLGTDIYILNSRLRINFDIFRKNTDPLLITLSLPSSAGNTTMPTNLGTLLTKGFTVQGNYQIIKKQDVIWSVSANTRHITSEYRNMSNALETFNKANMSRNMIRYYDGASPTAMWTVRSAGIDPATGQELFYTKDGEVTFSYDYDDEVVVGNTTPKFEGVVGTSLYYKGFSLSAYLRYRTGGQAFMSALFNKVENINSTSRWYNQDRRALYDRWHNPGDETYFKSITSDYSTPMSSRFVRDNNILRGESFSVGYETDAPWLRKIGASSMTVRAYMNDIFNWSSIKEERGTSYPFARSVSCSVGLRF